jgi:hypothetical protein
MVRETVQLLTSCIVAVFVLCGVVTAAVARDRFVQDRFAIGFWVDPPVADQRYAEIADANFTVVIGAFGARSAEQVQRQLELCEGLGLKALVACESFEPDRIPDGPACWGYLLKDEPRVGDFPALRERVDMLREARPGKLAFVNLYPTYVNLPAIGARDYDDYVSRYMQEVRPDVLCMDHYPLFKPGEPDGRDAYCRNLEAMRRHSLEHEVPFWNFFNAMPFGPHTDPTEAQLRWQVYASVAYGAKGVLYFCYQTPVGGEFAKGGALRLQDGRLGRHWYQAKRINAELKALGPILMGLTSTGVYRVKPGDDPSDVLVGTPIRAIARARHDPEHDYLAGKFEDTEGHRAVMLCNYRFAYTAWPTVEFVVDADRVLEVSKQTGQAAPIIDDSPGMPGLQVSLDAGEGRLFLIAAEAEKP